MSSQGVGMIYTGSILHLYGSEVLSMWDCECEQCVHIDPWDPQRKLSCNLLVGYGYITITHARAESFTRRPTDS